MQSTDQLLSSWFASYQHHLALSVTQYNNYIALLQTGCGQIIQLFLKSSKIEIPRIP